MHYNENILKLGSILNSVLAFLPTLFWGSLILGFEGGYMAFTTVICAVIHEAGHLLYLAFFTSSNHNIKSVVFGLKIKAVSVLSYKDEFFLYLFGPLSNLISGTLFLLFSTRGGEYFYSLAIINFATAVSNLLPIEGYDGYGILRVLCERHFHGTLLNILSRISTILIFLLCLFSIYLIDRYGGGYWIFAVFFVQMIKHFQKSIN